MSAQTITELLVEIGVDVKDAEEAERRIKALEKDTEDMAKAAEKADKSTSKWAAGLGKGLAVGAAAAAAAIAAASIAILSFVNDQTAALDATNKLAAALGISGEQMQALSFIAERSGVDQEKLKAAVLKTNAAMLSLAEGAAGPVTQALDDLGLSLEDFENRSTTEQIGLIGDRLNEIEDAAERSALAARIFGEDAGPALASLLKEGTDGLNALADSANILSQEDLDKASAFQDAMTNINNVIDNVVQGLAVDLAPVVQEVVEGVQSWVESNREFIDLGIDVVFTLLADVVNAIWREFKLLSAILSPVVRWLGEMGAKVDQNTGLITFFRKVITALFNPLNTLLDLVELAIQGLEKLGVVSEGSADKFRAKVDEMVNAASGFDVIAEKADRAAEATDDFFSQQASFEQGYGLLNPEKFQAFVASGEEGKASREARRERRRAELRAGPRPAAAAAGGKPAEKEPTSSVTFAEVISRLAHGDPTALAEDIKGLSAVTPETKEIKPTVAVTFMQMVFEAGSIQVTTSDPQQASSNFARDLSREVQRAGEVITSNIVR